MKYRKICESVNNKIKDITGIKDFFIYNSNQQGYLKINNKYL